MPKRCSDYYVWKKNEKKRKKRDADEMKTGESGDPPGSRKGKDKATENKEAAAPAPKDSTTTEEDQRRDKYRKGAPGERPFSGESSKTSPGPSSHSEKVGEGSSKEKRAISPGDEGLSDFDLDNSLFGSDTEADKPGPSRFASPNKKRKLDKEDKSLSELDVKKQKKKDKLKITAPSTLR